MEHTLAEIARAVGGDIIGDGTVALRGIASIRSAGSADLVFVEDARRLSEALASSAGAIITQSGAASKSTKPLLLCDQPRLAFARAAEMLMTAGPTRVGIHNSAVVDETAKLGHRVDVGAHAVIEAEVTIGDESRIGVGSYLGVGVRLGQNCTIGTNVNIYAGTAVGNRVIIHSGATLGSDGFGYVRDHSTGRYHKFPQVGRLEIEDDVEIGANATVDRGALDATRIGRGTKIDNLVHVGHNVVIGDDVVIAAQTGLSGSAVVEDGVIIGGQVGIADHVRVQAGAILGAQSGIPTKKVIRGKGVVFWGTPARPIREYLKELATLAKLAKNS